MKCKQGFFIGLSLVCCLSLTAQKIETKIVWLDKIPDAGSHIVYHPGQKLAIGDFKGLPNVDDAVALTSSGFAFEAGFSTRGENAVLTISVYCSFNKNESWMKERGKNEFVLAHEQRHFDISYLGAVEFVKKIKQISFQQQYATQLKAVYKEVVAQMALQQQQYDRETNHGINKQKQEEWNNVIGKKLMEAASGDIL